MTARLSPAQRRQHANLCRYRDNAADALKRLTDNTLAETIRRGHMAITDGYAAGYNHDRTTGGSPSSSTETAALALLDGQGPPPPGDRYCTPAENRARLAQLIADLPRPHQTSPVTPPAARMRQLHEGAR